jgi:hypothetical protein
MIERCPGCKRVVKYEAGMWKLVVGFKILRRVEVKKQRASEEGAQIIGRRRWQDVK